MSTSTPSRKPGFVAGDFPPDPLLSSGSFISSNTTPGANQGPFQGVRMSNGTDQVHPSPINWARQAESNSRKRAAPGDSWLPPGWRIEDKVRTSGATAGIRDRYYYSPGGHKFRSKTEVLHYLEHGTVKKGTRKAVKTNFHSDKFEGQGSPKVSKKVKEAPVPFNFDFESPPEKVSWAMTKAGEEAWAPFIGDDKVQDSVRRDWINAFKVITFQNATKLSHLLKTDM
ncbi:hypothetical protein AALP_AA8G387500 [Arabis alpina]|uniref:MBD domain-containing protein n=1 Tax=Arabis alpina TaxID=50452 RepID=A0A087GC68_ARAAL|nr:hypothetical protein AALP_AA8G387500 [Arabis alpina]